MPDPNGMWPAVPQLCNIKWTGIMLTREQGDNLLSVLLFFMASLECLEPAKHLSAAQGSLLMSWCLQPTSDNLLSRAGCQPVLWPTSLA